MKERRLRRVSRCLRLAVSATLLGALFPPRAAAEWSLEALAGSALNVPMRLTVEQRGEPGIRLTAHYATRPLRSPPYYAFRLERWAGRGAWGIEFVHHKIYLTNGPPQIEHFEITHGYNLLFAHRALRRGGLLLRTGAGVVIAHPEMTVRGEAFDGGGSLGGGYHLAGPAAFVSLGKRVPLGQAVFVAADGEVTLSRARVSADGLAAVVRGLALHGRVGIGRRL